MQPSVARKILGRLRATRSEPRVVEVRQALQGEVLSERELEVLRLLGQGTANREIAERLSLTEGTVKHYISSILAKIGLHDRTQASPFVVRHDVTQDESA